MKRPGYLMVKEAAVRYGVSRAKLHRLIQLGRLQTVKDPRDERATLLQIEELEALFRFSGEEVEDMKYKPATAEEAMPSGRLTDEMCARMDALRMRISGGRKLPGDSTDVIRREREKRSRQVYRAAFGTRKKSKQQA